MEGPQGKTAGPTGLASLVRQRWLTVLRSYVFTIAIGNLVWETAHLPLYTIWRTGTTGENAYAVVHCTLGDILLALGMLAAALVIAGSRDWPDRRFWPVAALAVPLGVGTTVLLEWLNVVAWKSWAYSDLMPVLPVFGFEVGLSPLLQWTVVPSLALWRASRTA